MSNLSTTWSKEDLRNTKVPWVIFIFLAAVFFVAEYESLYALQEGFGRGAEDLVRRTTEGTLRRQVVFVILGLFGVISLMRKRGNVLKVNGFLGWLILFYLAWVLLSLAWAEDMALTFRRLVLLAMFCLGALGACKRFSLRDVIWLAFFSTSLYVGVGLSAELVLGGFRTPVFEYRFAGTIHPNHQALNCAVLVFAAFSLAGSVDRGRKFLLACGVIGLVLLVLTRSRTAFASAILALFLYWAVVSSRSRKFVLFLALGFTFCLLLLLAGDLFFPALKGAILLGREDASTGTLTGRVTLWEKCLVHVVRRPFLGHGYGSFWNRSHVLEFSAAGAWGAGSAHSAYIDLALDLGLVGLVAYVLILLAGIRQSLGYYGTTLDTRYVFLGALLTLGFLDGLLESVIVHPRLPTFLTFVALARLAFRDPFENNQGINLDMNIQRL